AGPVYIEPRRESGAYERELFLTLKEFRPFLSQADMGMEFLAPTNRIQALVEASPQLLADAKGLPEGYELDYNFLTINGRMLGQGEPIRVKQGERVLLHILNASASTIRNLSLPG